MIVKAAIAAWKAGVAEVSVSPARPPGEARADLGEAEVVPVGRPTKGALSVTILPHSDARLARACPREYTEASLEGHARAFEFFGGMNCDLGCLIASLPPLAREHRRGVRAARSR